MSAKRSQPSSPEAEPRSAEEPQRSQPVSLQGFHLLPTELKDQVIRLACLASSSSPSTNPSPSGLDSGTMFKLSLVCRDLNAQVSPLLWRHVSITRPSALYDLVEAIKAQPGKAKDIESLHVGQYDPLPSYWWPLSSVNDEGEWSVWIASSLPRDRLPAGCEDRQSWRWDERPDGRREAAVYDSLQVAHRSLRASQIYEGGDVGITVEPIMELQAVLDLYLMELRRLEEASSEPVYPSLVLKDVPLSRPTGPPPAQVEPPGDAFVVPYAELLPHLARRGSLTDRFDHPLILERSSLKVIVRAPPVKSVLPNNVGSRATFTVHQGSDRVFDEQAGSNWFGWAPLQDAAAKDPALEKNPYSLARATATMSSVLDLTRGVLYATTSLRNISLTGYLEQVLRSTSHSSLLRASIGPTALPGWHATVPSHGVKFVQELRLCGKHLGGWEAHQVSVMTRLQRFEYCLWEPFVRRKRGDFIEHIFDHLFKVSDDTLNGIDGSADGEEEQPAAAGREERDLPLIVARLVPEDTMRVLAKAPSEEHRAAWLEGLPEPGALRRLMLKQNDAAVGSGASDTEDGGSSIEEIMYEDGRRFWSGVIHV